MSSFGELASILQLLNKLKQQYEKYQYNLEECGSIYVRCKNLMISLKSSNIDKRLNCSDITNYFIDLKKVLLEVGNYINKYESKSYFKQVLRAGKYQMKFQLLNNKLDKCHKDLQLILTTKNLDVALDIKTLLITPPQSPTTSLIADSFIRDPPPIDEFDERSVLGFGFFGTTHVMKIRDDPIGIKYAVKVVNVAKAIKNGITISEVEDEARKLQSVNHPNIVRYICCFYSGRNNSNFNIATELVNSGSLSAMIGKQHDERILLKWLIELTDALKYLHQKKILHRDLKPDNCMLTRSQQIKIIDLGLSTIISSSHQVRTRVGTVQYASFEKCNGKSYDGRDDIWAIGCIMTELIIKDTLMNRNGSISMYLDSEINIRRLNLIEECKSIFPKLGYLIEHCLAPLQEDRINAEMLLIKLEDYEKIEINYNSNDNSNSSNSTETIKINNSSNDNSNGNDNNNGIDNNNSNSYDNDKNNKSNDTNSSIIETSAKEDISSIEQRIRYQIEKRVLSERLEEEQKRREQQSKIDYEQNLKREIEEQSKKKTEAENMQIQRKEALEHYKKEQKMKALTDIKALKNCVSFQAHNEFIMSVVLSSDGCIIATASQDKTVKLWETTSGKCITTLHSHTDIVYCVAISLEVDFLVSSSRDQTVKLWDIKGTLQSTFYGHEGGIRTVCISTDSKLIISGSDDNTIKVWSIVGTCLNTFFGHRDFVRSLCITIDGLVCSGSSDKTIKIWNLSGNCIHTFEGHNSDVTSLSLSGDIIASSSGDSTVKLWRIKSKECIKTYTGDTSIGPVNSVYISPDKNLILAAQDKHLWYISRDDIKVIEYHHTQVIRCVSASSDNRIIVSASNDLNVKIYPTVNLNSSLFSSIINVSLLKTLFNTSSK